MQISKLNKSDHKVWRFNLLSNAEKNSLNYEFGYCSNLRSSSRSERIKERIWLHRKMRTHSSWGSGSDWRLCGACPDWKDCRLQHGQWRIAVPGPPTWISSCPALVIWSLHAIALPGYWHTGQWRGWFQGSLPDVQTDSCVVYPSRSSWVLLHEIAIFEWNW